MSWEDEDWNADRAAAAGAQCVHDEVVVPPSGPAKLLEAASGVSVRPQEAESWEDVDWDHESKQQNLAFGPILVLLSFKGSVNVLRKSLQNSERLSPIRQRLEGAGLDLQPPWANGGMLLTTVAHARVAERLLIKANLEMQKFKVLVSSEYEDDVLQSLRTLPYRQRPKTADSLNVSLISPQLQSRLEIKNTFLHMRSDSMSEGSQPMTKSSADQRGSHTNPRQFGRTMNFDSLAQPLAGKLWDTISLLSAQHSSSGSHNTGFTGGTSDFKGFFSKHARGRMLERDIDQYMICHTVARGGKTKIGQGERWRFEKDGVVVISNSERPDLTIITAWFDGGVVLESVYRKAQGEYDKMLDSLRDSLDEDDRVQVLLSWLEDDKERGTFQRSFYGIDLVMVPPDCPLLHWLAQMGYHRCVKELLDRGDRFQDGLGFRGKKMFTILHCIAWGGHPEVLDVLGDETVAKLVDIGNDFSELPESTAFLRFCELQHQDDVDSQRFLRVAARCRQIRTGGSHVTERTFRQEANLELQAIRPSDATCSIPFGADLHKVATLLESPTWRCTEFKVQYLKLSDSCLIKLRIAMLTNFNLGELILENCGLSVGLALDSLVALFSEHPGMILKLSLSGNPLGDEGIARLLISPVLKIPCLNLSNVGMSPQGLCKLMFGIKSQELPITERLQLDRNDLAEFGSTAPASMIILKDALTQAACRVTHLSLAGTRLTHSQLQLLVDVVRMSPSLNTICLVDITLSDEFAVANKSNPLLKALADTRSQVTRVEVDILQHAELFTALYKAPRMRNEQLPSGSASSALPMQATPGGKGIAKGSATKKVMSSWPPSSMEFIQTSKSIAVRMGSYAWNAATQQFHVCLHTPTGCVPNIVDTNSKFETARRGQGFQVRLSYEKLATHRCLTVSSTQHHNVMHSCLSETCILYYRPFASSMLMFPSPNSECGRNFLARLSFGVIPDHFHTDARFPSSYKTSDSGRLDVTALMQGLRLADFADWEVNALATLDNQSSFQDFTGGQRKVRACAKASLRRLARLPVIADVKKLFSGELKRRRSITPVNADKSMQKLVMDTPPPSWLPAFPGSKDMFVLDNTSISVQKSLHHRFSSSMTVHGVSHERECISDDDMWHLKVVPIEISEDIIDHEFELPLGLILHPSFERQQPSWIRTDAENLKSNLGWYTSRGFSSLPAVISDIAASWQATSHARLVKRTAEAGQPQSNSVHPHQQLGDMHAEFNG